METAVTLTALLTVLALAGLQSVTCSTYTGNLYKVVSDPELPNDYTSITSSTVDNCPSTKECTRLCERAADCEATVYDSANTNCLLYTEALINITSATQSNGLKYVENVCAETAWHRPSYCKLLPSPVPIQKDCQGYYEMGVTTSGVYTIQPEGYDSFEAWCDFDASHGWTVIQRRQDGSVDFFLYWADYKAGFGNKDGEYWLGNDNIHALTQTNQKLNIYLRRYDGGEADANYTQFVVNAESDNYRLTISGYSGNADDSMAGGTGHSHSGQYFSTRDRDYTPSCANNYKGGWWYNNCFHSNLNGQYTSGSTASSTNAVWAGSFTNHGVALHKIIMRVTRD